MMTSSKKVSGARTVAVSGRSRRWFASSSYRNG